MVRLVEEGELRTGSETDSVGRFFLRTPGPGLFRIRASRLGYETTESQDLRVGPTDTVSVEFRMSPDAVVLEPLTVTARSGRGRDDFRRRRNEWGRGMFFDPAAVDSLNPKHAVEVLDLVPDVDVRWDWRRNRHGGGEMIPAVRSVLGRGCLLYVVDGVAVRSDWAGYQLGILEARHVEAVEVYRSVLEVPPELRRFTSTIGGNLVNCGLVVYWTREGW